MLREDEAARLGEEDFAEVAFFGFLLENFGEVTFFGFFLEYLRCPFLDFRFNFLGGGIYLFFWQGDFAIYKPI